MSLYISDFYHEIDHDEYNKLVDENDEISLTKYQLDILRQLDSVNDVIKHRNRIVINT